MSWSTGSAPARAHPTSAASSNVLRRDGKDLKIAYRRAVLDLEALSWHGAVSIIF